jgi:hypothetical protein
MFRPLKVHLQTKPNQINNEIVALIAEFVLLVGLTQQDANNKNNILNNK